MAKPNNATELVVAARSSSKALMALCPSPSLISVTKPFTPSTLRHLRSVLTAQQPQHYTAKALSERNAAVLIPFCNVNNQPGILLEVRAKTLRSHSGELSFPGGRVDDTDASLVAAALRETHEELGIDVRRVDVLGAIGPPELNMRGDLRVWPFVGFVHAEQNVQNYSDGQPLPSIDLAAIRKEASPAEVATAIHLPLSALVAPSRLRPSKFRGCTPYWAIDVTDLVEPAIAKEAMTTNTSELSQGELPGPLNRIEVWGLTGWYLSLLMRVLRVAE